MINILLDTLDFSADFLYEELKRYIHPEDKVVILAFSYRDSDVRCLADWNALYRKRDGFYYQNMVSPFLRYGIPEDHIKWINYYTESKSKAAELICGADILYLPGGLPDRMMGADRRVQFEKHATSVPGSCAGIQCRCTHSVRGVSFVPRSGLPGILLFQRTSDSERFLFGSAL